MSLQNYLCHHPIVKVLSHAQQLQHPQVVVSALAAARLALPGGLVVGAQVAVEAAALVAEAGLEVLLYHHFCP